MARLKTVAFLSILVFLAGCSRGSHLVVGSKNFTEQMILGEIVAQHLENRLHQPVDRKLGLGGTLLAHQALLKGEIDVYPEYTGTAFTNVAKHQPVSDPTAVLGQLRVDYKVWNLEWLDSLGFENSFAMVVRGEDARNRHLTTLSDAAADPQGFALGAGFEFLTRPDGVSLLDSAYGLHWTSAPKSMDLGLLYTALTNRQVSMVAAATTDGILSVIDAKVLADDKKAFPSYHACLVVRSQALAATPTLRSVLAELSGAISTEAMQKMNHEVDGKHRQSAEVAREFLSRVIR